MKLLFSAILLLCSTVVGFGQVVIDSDITLEEALSGSAAPEEILQQMTLLDVEYWGFDSLLHRGQIVVNKAVAEDVAEVFEYIKQVKYPVFKVVPVQFDLLGGDTSMDEMNYSSSFFYRKMVGGSKSLSRHALGLAVDINPHENPYFNSRGDTIPKGKHYDPLSPKALTRESLVVKKFLSFGWTWGGNWSNPKDYMHFEKKI